MKRRTLIRAGALLGAVASTGLPLSRRAHAASPSDGPQNWSIAELRTGGTTGLPAQLPAPTFRALPQCVVTPAKTLGPCHTNNVPIRQDVTEGVTGLPTRVSLRIVDAKNCAPIANADVEIWHADVRGVYSGRAANMCNPGDQAAKGAGFLRGRQLIDAQGIASFITVYPGWYGGRTPHIHVRILVDQRELLITQLLFDDALNDLVYQGHPDYAKRPARSTTNQGDMMFSTAEIARFTFDTTRLDAGLVQASYTVGVTS